METVFAHAAHAHHIPWILNPDDVMTYPNERSLLMYASFFYNLFCDTPPVLPPANPRRSMTVLQDFSKISDGRGGGGGGGRGRLDLIRSMEETAHSRLESHGVTGRGRGVTGSCITPLQAHPTSGSFPISSQDKVSPRIGPEISIPVNEIVDFSVDIDISRLKMDVTQEGLVSFDFYFKNIFFINFTSFSISFILFVLLITF